MAAKEYKVTLPNKITVMIWANSAEQAARRAEREYGMNRVVTQRKYVSNVTRKQFADVEPADLMFGEEAYV